uniref:Uncharacterized protein n=1 Tax=Ditylenchus dipsaci TaxID=166011 RepID=A0A915DFU5_9BILA
MKKAGGSTLHLDIFFSATKMRWQTNLLLVMIVAAMMAITADAAPFWNNFQYLACKTGEIVLYKFNTGKWPPSPFQNDEAKEEPLIPSTPHRTPEPIVEMPPSTARTNKNTSNNTRQPKPPGFIYDTPKSAPFSNVRRT